VRKKLSAIDMLMLLALTAAGIGAGFVFAKGMSKPAVQVVHELPAWIEPANPVPKVRNWSEGGRQYYYFNWGLQPNSGYRLELAGLKAGKIMLRAVTPGPGEITARVISYPYLLIALPEGRYRYEAFDASGKPLPELFKPERPPLRLRLFLPGGSGVERTVLRDPIVNTAGKSLPRIALEALFSQPEMLEYAEADVGVRSATFSQAAREWLIDLGPGWNYLEDGAKAVLSRSISQTVTANGAGPWNRVRIRSAAAPGFNE
jgi:hypothetical protein